MRSAAIGRRAKLGFCPLTLSAAGPAGAAVSDKLFWKNLACKPKHPRRTFFSRFRRKIKHLKIDDR
jgi:hypothetical protein